MCIGKIYYYEFLELPNVTITKCFVTTGMKKMRRKAPILETLLLWVLKPIQTPISRCVQWEMLIPTVFPIFMFMQMGYAQFIVIFCFGLKEGSIAVGLDKKVLCFTFFRNNIKDRCREWMAFYLNTLWLDFSSPYNMQHYIRWSHSVFMPYITVRFIFRYAHFLTLSTKCVFWGLGSTL